MVFLFFLFFLFLGGVRPGRSVFSSRPGWRSCHQSLRSHTQLVNAASRCANIAMPPCAWLRLNASKSESPLCIQCFLWTHTGIVCRLFHNEYTCFLYVTSTHPSRSSYFVTVCSSFVYYIVESGHCKFGKLCIYYDPLIFIPSLALLHMSVRIVC